MRQPKRGAAPKHDPASQPRPTLDELAARVKWLEECQLANIQTVEALYARVDRYASAADPVRRSLRWLVWLAVATSCTGVLVLVALLMRWA